MGRINCTWLENMTKEKKKASQFYRKMDYQGKRTKSQSCETNYQTQDSIYSFYFYCVACINYCNKNDFFLNLPFHSQEGKQFTTFKYNSNIPLISRGVHPPETMKHFTAPPISENVLDCQEKFRKLHFSVWLSPEKWLFIRQNFSWPF